MGTELIQVLQYVLPGLFAAAIFYLVTPYKRPPPFEQVVQAMVFTLLIQVATFVEQQFALLVGRSFSLGHWTEQSEFAANFINALLLGGGIGYIGSSYKARSWLYRFSGKMSLDASEWFAAFEKNERFVVLQLKDGRRLFGWPKQWPSDPNEGHLLMMRVSWLTGKTKVRAKGVDSLLIAAQDVKWVEFLNEPRSTP